MHLKNKIPVVEINGEEEKIYNMHSWNVGKCQLHLTFLDLNLILAEHYLRMCNYWKKFFLKNGTDMEKKTTTVKKIRVSA